MTATTIIHERLIMGKEQILLRRKGVEMQTNLSDLKHIRKVSFAAQILLTLIFMSLMAGVTFSTASNSNPEIQALPLTMVPTIDGNWTGSEWDDALQYNITGSGGTGYIRVKYDSNYLYVIIDSVWDPAHDPITGSYEGTYVAFDTSHDDGAAPQPDDYLFFCGYSTWMNAWQGDGTKWTIVTEEFIGEQTLGTSPNNATAHRIDEMRVPLDYVGSIGSTSGFYVIVRDEGSDPDGFGPLPPTAWVEWPDEAGGDPRGWPMPSGYIDPCPAPSAWGTLTFLQRPVASFTYSPDVPDVNETVTFDASASQDSDGSIVNYTWNFGDGYVITINTTVITHIFSTGGSYRVNLTVIDDTGLNGSVVHMITVGVGAAFTFSPSAPNPGDVVIFNATASYSRSGTIANYTWNWGDTSSNDTTNRIITHTFSPGGSYDVNLTVTDDTGLNASVVHTVYVGAPRANFTFWPSAPNLGDAVIFNASGSYDLDGNVTSYAWDWGDSSGNVTANAVITYTFSTAGNYKVILTVIDNLGLNDSFAHTFTVYAPREARFSFSPSTPNVGDAVTFNASVSKDLGGTIANYTWNFDDGNITTVNAPTDTIIHFFSASGSYNVNLTITDNDGLKSWYNNTVNVGIPPVQATAPFSPTIPTIDGAWSSGEWDDANEYIISGPGGEGYMLVKWGPGNITGDFLYILIDSPWDATNATGGVLENAYVAFDSEHDKSTVGPQTDDYLFNDGFSQWNHAWNGSGTIWTILWQTEINYTEMGYLSTRWSGSSPKNVTMHRIEEFRVPLDFIGNSTRGFYVIVIDGSSDPDGWGLNLPPTAWVEWPLGAGGDPRGWPEPPDYIDPCPNPDKWGYLILEPPMKASSNVTLDIGSSSITLGENVTITGTVSNSTGAIAGVDVTIQYKTGTTGWTNITTVTADSTGSYTYDWTPTKAGTYEIKASWAGDADTYGAESEEKTLEVASEPIPILVIVAALAVVAVVVAIAVYLLKVRKPKR
jgi:PKD repeat protein